MARQANARRHRDWIAQTVLFELAKGKGDEEKTVDVVAVYGLQGDAYRPGHTRMAPCGSKVSCLIKSPMLAS
jgi:hypothetical protein